MKYELVDIRERVENTSFEKVYVKGDPWKGYVIKHDNNGTVIAEVPCRTDAEFFEYAREDILSLLAEVKRLNAKVSLLEEYGRRGNEGSFW